MTRVTSTHWYIRSSRPMPLRLHCPSTAGMPSSPGWIKYAISATISAMASETAWTISLRNTRRAPVIRPRLAGPAPTPNHHLRSFAESTRNPHVLLLRPAAGGVWRARRDHRTPAVERGQAPGDVRDDGVLGAVGTATELARDRAGVWDQLGGSVSLGGMVGAVGLGPPELAGGGVAGGG